MKKVLLIVICSSFALAATESPAEAGRFRARWNGCNTCNGCSDPCASMSCGSTASPGVPSCSIIPIPGTTIQQVVLVPTYVTETRSVCSTEYKEEERQRAYTVYTTVPVEEERIRTCTVMVPRTETKTVEYSVPVSSRSEKTVQYTTTVPVYSDVEETYTIKVPVLKDVTEQYTIKVPVVRDVPFTYQVSVPFSQKQMRTRTVTNVVPVTKTRTVDFCLPVSKTKLVTRDLGRWETQVAEAGAGCSPSAGAGCTQAAGPGCAASSGCGQNAGCGRRRCRRCGGSCGANGGCASGCGGTAAPAVCNRVWVPNVITEEVTVVESSRQTQEIKYTSYEQRNEEVPYECVSVCYQPEQRTGTKQVVEYVDQTQTRMRKAVEYQDEPRTRIKKVLAFKEETHTETYPVITYGTETRTKQINYTVQVPESKNETYKVTRYDRVPEIKMETYRVKVPVPVVKEVQVQICKMVPKVVDVTVSCDTCQTGQAAPLSPCAQGAPCSVSPPCSTCR